MKEVSPRPAAPKVATGYDLQVRERSNWKFRKMAQNLCKAKPRLCIELSPHNNKNNTEQAFDICSRQKS